VQSLAVSCKTSLAVVASKTCLSDLQLSSEQVQAQNQHLLFEGMRQKVGLLSISSSS